MRRNQEGFGVSKKRPKWEKCHRREGKSVRGMPWEVEWQKDSSYTTFFLIRTVPLNLKPQ